MESLVLLLLLIGGAVLLVRLRRQVKRSQALDAAIQQMTERQRLATQEIETLSRYRGIADADAKATAMLASAQAEWQRAREGATALVAGAQKDAEEKVAALTAAAHEERAKAAEEVTTALGQARQQAMAMNAEAKAALDAAALSTFA